MAEDFLTEQEVMDRWNISKAKLDELVQEGSLNVIEREGQRGFSRDQVVALESVREELRVAGAGAGEQEEAAEEIELAETAEVPSGQEEELEADELFDFSEELETELTEEPREEAAAAPPAEQAQEVSEEEADMITEVVDVSGVEAGEEDILGDVIEDVGSELQPAEGETGPPAGEETLDMEEETAGEDVTADLTGGEEALEDQELEEILAGEEELGEAAEEEFGVPYEAQAAPAEVPVPGWAVVVLLLALVVQVIAVMFAVENAVNPRYATGITKALNLFKGE